MNTKEKILQLVQQLPDDVSIEDVIERLQVLAKIERGLMQADQGETISNETVKSRIGKWLS